MESSAAAPPPETPDEHESIGVRELRQNASVYLRRVKEGETFTVTDRGVPVATLGPVVAKPVNIIDQLIAEGVLRPAKYPRGHPDRWNYELLELPPGTKPLSETIIEMRDEERY